jgi:hypothetical protein
MVSEASEDRSGIQAGIVTAARFGPGCGEAGSVLTAMIGRLSTGR